MLREWGEGGQSHLWLNLSVIEECTSEMLRECKLYDEGLNSKVKVNLALYRTFSKKVEVFACGE